eukprot:scaffold1399_cov410-Prasinococcus_capsulatus_cf.AAC.13
MMRGPGAAALASRASFEFIAPELPRRRARAGLGWSAWAGARGRGWVGRGFPLPWIRGGRLPGERTTAPGTGAEDDDDDAAAPAVPEEADAGSGCPSVPVAQGPCQRFTCAGRPDGAAHIPTA